MSDLTAKEIAAIHSQVDAEGPASDEEIKAMIDELNDAPTSQVFKANPYHDKDGQFTSKDKDADGVPGGRSREDQDMIDSVGEEDGRKVLENRARQNAYNSTAEAKARLERAGRIMGGGNALSPGERKNLAADRKVVAVAAAKAKSAAKDLVKEMSAAGIKAKFDPNSMSMSIEDTYIAGAGEKKLNQLLQDWNDEKGTYAKYFAEHGLRPKAYGHSESRPPKNREDFSAGVVTLRVYLRQISDQKSERPIDPLGSSLGPLSQ